MADSLWTASKNLGALTSLTSTAGMGFSYHFICQAEELDATGLPAPGKAMGVIGLRGQVLPSKSNLLGKT